MHDKELVILVRIRRSNEGNLLARFAVVDVNSARYFQLARLQIDLVDGQKGAVAALVKAGLAGELGVRLVVHGVELDGAVVGRIGRGAQLAVYVALGRAGQTARYALVEAEVVARLRVDGEAARLGQSVRVVVDELVLGAA